MVTKPSDFDPRRPHAFQSYTHFDDDKLEGGICWLRDKLQKAVSLRISDEFRIFLDVDIEPGESWSDRLDTELQSAHFFLPILTPKFFDSEFCRREAKAFLEYEARASWDALIHPIYLVQTDILDNRKSRAADGLAAQLYRRKYHDWRDVALELRDSEARKKIVQLAEILARQIKNQRQSTPSIHASKPSIDNLRKAVESRRVNSEYWTPFSGAAKALKALKSHQSAEMRIAEAAPFLGRDIERGLRWLSWAPWVFLAFIGILLVIALLWVLAGPRLIYEMGMTVPGFTPEISQEETATNPSTRTFRDCNSCLEMIASPAGSFLMGSPDHERWRNDDEGPQHRVTIETPFALGRYEVTRGQFSQFVLEASYDVEACHYWDNEIDDWIEDGDRGWRDPGFDQTDDHPVVCVSWYDAQAYVDWLSRKAGKTYRLPSEAEWEYAVRAGTTTPYFWGRERHASCLYANGLSEEDAKENGFSRSASHCKDRYAQTAPVGSFRANGFGLYDMAGNVWEWVEDVKHSNYKDAPKDGSVWTAERDGWRVNRGGSWVFGPFDLRSANRRSREPEKRFYGTGFRVARDFPDDSDALGR